MTQLFLHSDVPSENGQDKLLDVYEKAVREAVELYIFSAYLTDWQVKTRLNNGLKEFKFIFGQDFGLSKKSAVQSVLRWLPSNLKFNFMVAQDIQGFHPKAVFWKNAKHECYALIGSSNLTDAAFNSNFEVNILTEISKQHFENVKAWASRITDLSVPVSEDWLEHYQEADWVSKREKIKATAIDKLFTNLPPYDEELILARRQQMTNHQTVRSELKQLISDCADGKVENEVFYCELNKLWSWKDQNNGKGIGNRFQSKGWTRKGKGSNFQELSMALKQVFQSSDKRRDAVVAEQYDRLEERKDVGCRKAVFTEMLCQEYPDQYPVWNHPVDNFLKANQFRAAKGSSVGSKYIDLSRKFRALVARHDKIRNLAELDILISANYRGQSETDGK